MVATFAPILSISMVLPQLYKTYQTKRVKDLSLYMILLLLFANILWLLHGYFIADISLMVTGVIQSFLVTILLLLYYFYK
jgi:uncharacterized protein with PQ loop repeat